MLTVKVIRKDGSETLYPAISVVYRGLLPEGSEAGHGVLINHTEMSSTHVSEGEIYVMADGKTIERYYLVGGKGDPRVERNRRVRAA